MKNTTEKYYPKYCVWEITFACNMRCNHCGSKATSVKRKEELTINEAYSVAGELAELGCERITLSGGELFLRSDWHLIAQRLKNNRINVGLITNGYLIKENLSKIDSLLPLDVVAISIDGAPKTHNAIRGISDSFEKSYEAFRLLKKAGAATGAVTSVSKINIKDLEEIYKILCELQVNSWQIQMVFLGGRMREHPHDCPTPSDMIEVANFIAEKRKEKLINVFPADCIGYYTSLERKIRPQIWNGCYAGQYVLGIEANGNIKGCLSLAPELHENNPFVEGNVKIEPLADIWNKPGAFSYNRNFDLRKIKGLCRKCRYKRECRAGCNSTSYFYHNNTYQTEYCIYQEEILKKGIEQPKSIFAVPTFTKKGIFT